jgi:hypothetical protein
MNTGIWPGGDTLMPSRKLGLFYGGGLDGVVDTVVCRLLR